MPENHLKSGIEFGTSTGVPVVPARAWLRGRRPVALACRPWKVRLLRGDTDQLLPGGELVVIRVDKRVTIGRVKLTLDEVRANPRVLLRP